VDAPSRTGSVARRRRAISDYLIGALAALIVIGVLAALDLGGAIGGITATCVVVVGWTLIRVVRHAS
jgi:predicted lipid-binding transport protein (Tim44 family)